MRRKKRINRYLRKLTGKRYKEENEAEQQEKQVSKEGQWKDTETRQRS